MDTRHIPGPMSIEHSPDNPELWVVYDGTKRISQHETREDADEALYQYVLARNERK